MTLKLFKINILLVALVLMRFVAVAQGEINATIIFDYSQVQPNQQDKDIMEEAKTAMTNFMNNRKWTADNFAPEERIKCNIAISIVAISGVGVYTATAQIQSSRPIYGTSYESTLLNYFDKDFNFSYTQGQPMDFNENIYINEVTTLLGFYANIILGMDYDSFSKLGGTAYFDKVRNIANNVPNPTEPWQQFGTNPNTRAGFAENLQSQQYIPIREWMYTYHRLILDDYLNQKDPVATHKKLLECLIALKQFNNQKRPNATAVRQFFFAKGTELMSMFSQSSPEIKKTVIDLCSEMDPSNTQKYQKLMTMN